MGRYMIIIQSKIISSLAVLINLLKLHRVGTKTYFFHTIARIYLSIEEKKYFDFIIYVTTYI